MKRFRLIVRVSDQVLDDLGANGTGEDDVRVAATEIGLVVEEIEGLDCWPDPPTV
jgi:hypothetical protein